MGFSMTASGPAAFVPAVPGLPARRGFSRAQLEHGGAASALQLRAPGPLSDAQLCAPFLSLVPRSSGLGPMIEYKVGGHPDPRVLVLRDGARRATSPPGRLQGLTGVAGVHLPPGWGRAAQGH